MITASEEDKHSTVFETEFVLSEVNQQLQNQSVQAFSSPIKVERQHDGNVLFSHDQDQSSKKGEMLSDFLLCSSEIVTFFSHYRDFGITVFDPGGALFILLVCTIYITLSRLRWMPWDRGKQPFDICCNLVPMITEKHNQEKVSQEFSNSSFFKFTVSF
jgi:hypothetical protein